MVLRIYSGISIELYFHSRTNNATVSRLLALRLYASFIQAGCKHGRQSMGRGGAGGGGGGRGAVGGGGRGRGGRGRGGSENHFLVQFDALV